jgi:hypothetical protein
MKMLSFGLKRLILTTIVATSCLAASSVFAAPTAQDLKRILECQADYDTYHDTLLDYDKALGQLGWKRHDDPHQPFIYIYKNKQAVEFFGMPTQEIGLSSMQYSRSIAKPM